MPLINCPAPLAYCPVYCPAPLAYCPTVLFTLLHHCPAVCYLLFAWCVLWLVPPRYLATWLLSSATVPSHFQRSHGLGLRVWFRVRLVTVDKCHRTVVQDRAQDRRQGGGTVHRTVRQWQGTVGKWRGTVHRSVCEWRGRVGKWCGAVHKEDRRQGAHVTSNSTSQLLLLLPLNKWGPVSSMLPYPCFQTRYAWRHDITQVLLQYNHRLTDALFQGQQPIVIHV